MNYFSPYDIGIGDKVTYKDNIYDVIINYIRGETDAEGYTPEKDYTVLGNNVGRRIICFDYKQLNVISQITDHGRLI